MVRTITKCSSNICHDDVFTISRKKSLGNKRSISKAKSCYTTPKHVLIDQSSTMKTSIKPFQSRNIFLRSCDKVNKCVEKKQILENDKINNVKINEKNRDECKDSISSDTNERVETQNYENNINKDTCMKKKTIITHYRGTNDNQNDMKHYKPIYLQKLPHSETLDSSNQKEDSVTSYSKRLRNKSFSNLSNCPVCCKQFNLGKVSKNEINYHVLMCSEIQMHDNGIKDTSHSFH
mmetsp:Transcript_15646/g.22265  ORF Transcript_15646/g.22265 Transcript_15646/m.22265 type:complete len:235 (-) Transcript_15646:198-902(-)